MASEIRGDLVDRGIFRPGRPARVAESRRPAFYGGGEVPRAEVVSVHVGLDGEYAGDPNAAAARYTEGGGVVRHYVRVATEGPDQGHIADPWGMYFRPEKLPAISSMTGRPVYEFREVKKPVFDDYVGYLRSRDRVLYRRANGAQIDG